MLGRSLSTPEEHGRRPCETTGDRPRLVLRRHLPALWIGATAGDWQRQRGVHVACYLLLRWHCSAPSPACACYEGVRPGAVPGMLRGILGPLEAESAPRFTLWLCRQSFDYAYISLALRELPASGIYDCPVCRFRTAGYEFYVRRHMLMHMPLPLDSPTPVTDVRFHQRA